MTKLSKNAQVPQCDKTAVMQSVIASELRIGNLVFGNYENEEDETIKSTVCEILGYDPFNNYYWVENKQGIEEFCNFQGIPATESRLIELGFEKVYDGNYKRYQINLLETNIYLRPSLDKWYFGFVNKGQDCEINDCYELEFIHEIQNLIFSLTRVSLTVA